MDKHKKGIIGGGAVVGTALAAALLIGRDPAKAAKVLTGSNVPKDKIYKNAQAYAESLLKMDGSEYKVSLEDFKAFFKRGEKFEFEEALENLSKAVSEALNKDGAKPEEAVKEAIESLQAKTSALIQERNNSFVTMDGITEERAEEFLNSAKKDVEILRNAFGEGKEADSALTTLFNKLDNALNENPTDFVIKMNAFEACPESFLPDDMIFYHGTSKPHKIYRSGITPYKSKQINNPLLPLPVSREGGAAVYLTPDIEVASSFATPLGKAIPFQAQDCNVAIGSQDSHIKLSEKIAEFINERIIDEADEGISLNPKNLIKMYKKMQRNVATKEIITKEIVQANGYDAIYTNKGINTLKNKNVAIGALTDVDAILGRPETQFICYNPEKIHITHRGFKQRVADTKLRTVQYTKTIYNSMKAGLSMYAETLKVMINSIKNGDFL